MTRLSVHFRALCAPSRTDLHDERVSWRELGGSAVGTLKLHLCFVTHGNSRCPKCRPAHANAEATASDEHRASGERHAVERVGHPHLTPPNSPTSSRGMSATARLVLSPATDMPAEDRHDPPRRTRRSLTLASSHATTAGCPNPAPPSSQLPAGLSFAIAATTEFAAWASVEVCGHTCLMRELGAEDRMGQRLACPVHRHPAIKRRGRGRMAGADRWQRSRRVGLGSAPRSGRCGRSRSRRTPRRSRSAGTARRFRRRRGRPG
jgi:hypothetical protein